MSKQAKTNTLVPVAVDGWILFRGEGGYWIKDVDLAERAELARPREIRSTIEACIADRLIFEARIGAVAARANPSALYRTEVELVASGKGRRQPITVYYLNREAALHVATRLRTPKAIELRVAVVRVFVLVMEGRPATQKGPKLLPQNGGDVRALAETIRAQVATIGIAGDMGERLLAGAAALDQATANQDPDQPIDPRLAREVSDLGVQAEQMKSLAELAAKRGKTREFSNMLAMLPALSERISAAKAQRRGSRRA